MPEIATESTHKITEPENQQIAENLAQLFLKTADGDSEKNRQVIGLSLGISYLSGLLKNPLISDYVLRSDIAMSIQNAKDLAENNSKMKNDGRPTSTVVINDGFGGRWAKKIQAETFEEASKFLPPLAEDDVLDVIFDTLTTVDKHVVNLKNSGIREIVFAKATSQYEIDRTSEESVMSEILSLIEDRKNEEEAKAEKEFDEIKTRIQNNYTTRLNKPGLQEFAVEFIRLDESHDLDELMALKKTRLESIEYRLKNSISQCLEYCLLTYPVKFLKNIKERRLMQTRLGRETLDSLIQSFESLGAKKLMKGSYLDERVFMDDLINILQQNISIDIPYLLKLSDRLDNGSL